MDHSYALAKIRIEQITKTNAALLEDNNRRRKDSSKLKSELKLQQQSHGEQLNQMRADFDLALGHREMELKNLQTSLHSTAALHKREVQMVKEEAERKQEENHTEIYRLRDEIKRTQVTNLFMLVLPNDLFTVLVQRLLFQTGFASGLLGQAYGCS